MGRCTKRHCESRNSLKQNETSSQHLLRYKRMGANKLTRIKDLESFLRKAVLINNSIQFCNENVKTEGDMISSETNVVNDDYTVEDINSGSLLIPGKGLEIDNILNVLSSSITDLECLNEIKKVSTGEKSVTVDNSDDTIVNNDSTKDIDNILSDLELPPLLDPLESFEEFRNNFLESEAAKNEGFDSVETFEDLVKDFTHCTDDDVDIPLDENNMNQIYSC